jgi:hypothetical protein
MNMTVNKTSHESYCIITFCPRKGPDYSTKGDEDPMPVCDRHAELLGLKKR